MKRFSKIAVALAGLVVATQALAQITFYEHDGFAGRSFTARGDLQTLEAAGFNDRVSSVLVERGPWEVCDDAGFRGRCMVLRPGRYPSLSTMGLNDRLSSARSVRGDDRVEDERYAPTPPVYYDGRRRGGERLFEAQVTAVRAVVGTPEKRCWMEREQVPQGRSQRGDASVPGGIVGAVIGGILGHQVGSGSGRDLATVGGVVAGAAIGANVGRDREGRAVVTRDVQRCVNEPHPERPDYWDVTYQFRGQEHHMQTTAPPGPTVTVNRRGEPRV